MSDPKFWCLVDGGRIPFSVHTSPTLTIDELKAKIKQKNENDPHFERVDALKLMLWKPRDIIPVLPSNTLAQRLQGLGLGLAFSQIADVLDPTITVERSFQPQDPSSPHLDVIVQTPALTPQGEPPSKRQRLAYDPGSSFKGLDDDDLEILKQFWRHLWQDEQDPFDEVIVHRGADPIDSDDVPATMKVLRLPEILSPLDNVMIRSDYEEALKDFDTMGFTGKKSVIILGHPGIGKTILLYYILVKRLLKQKPTILQTRSEYPFFFYSKGVEVLSPFSSVDPESEKYQNTWALVDINVSVQAPASMLSCETSPFFLVMSSSPRPSPLRKLKKYRRPGAYWSMNPFSLVELIQARQLQQDPYKNSKESDIQKFFENYGPSARDCYHYCKPDELENYAIDVRGKVNGMSWELITQVLTSHPADVIMEEASHKVVLVQPQSDNRAESRTTIISGTISQLLWERDSDQQWRNHRNLFLTLLRIPDAKGFCGNFFEPAFHALCLLGTTTKVKIYPMALKPGGITNNTFTVPEPESESGCVELELGQRLRFSFDKENPITSLDAEFYYRSRAPNPPSLDSFVYDPVSEQINLFQVTVAKTHDLVSRGVKDVYELGERLRIGLKIRIIVLFGDAEVEYKVRKNLYDDWRLQVYVVRMTAGQLYHNQ